MSNILLAFPDYIQPTVVYTPTFSGGSWLTTLPLTNLQLDGSCQVAARSTDTTIASTKFDVDLKIERSIGLIAIGRHTVSSEGTVVVKLSNVSNFATTVHVSSSLAVWPGSMDTEQIEGYNVNWYYKLPTAVSARYVRIEITDTANPAGYIDLARLMVASTFQPTVNFVYGSASLGWEHNTSQARSLGGIDWFERKTPRRILTFTLDSLTDAEAFDTIFEMIRRLGIDGQTFVAMDPSIATFRRWQQSFVCTLRTLNALEYPYYGANSMAFELAEVL